MDIPYPTRRIRFQDRTAIIILHGTAHRPHSPLLALCNVLSLKNNLGLSPDKDQVSHQELLELLASRLHAAIDIPGNKLRGEKYIQDAVNLLPTLNQCHPDIRFRWISDFRDFPERNIFRLLKVPIYHGRIVNPRELSALYEAIGKKSLTELRAEGGELFESFVENIHNKKVTIHGLEQLCTVLNVDDQNTDTVTLCTFVVNDQFVVMSKVNKVLKILRDAENWPDENMWIAPLGLYHEKWQVLGRPAEYQVLIIGSHNFNVLAIEAITEMNELNKEMIYRHCELMDDAWPVVSTVDLDLIVVQRGIVINMGLKEFQDISKRWRRELAFRGAIFKSPANISLASVELGTLMYDNCK